MLIPVKQFYILQIGKQCAPEGIAKGIFASCFFFYDIKAAQTITIHSHTHTQIQQPNKQSPSTVR